jgi:hypothetical protein
MYGEYLLMMGNKLARNKLRTNSGSGWFSLQKIDNISCCCVCADVMVIQCTINGVAEDGRRHGMGLNVEELM